MNSLILSTGIRILFPLFIFFSLFMLFRGHNEPGGGFIGGLIAATAFVFYSIANGPERTRNLLPFDPIVFIAAGLMLSLLSGFYGMLHGEEFMKAYWTDFYIPLLGKPGSPIVFDVGVYLLVIGTILKITFSMAEEAFQAKIDKESE
jgi:multicomponent Na+:H+ antiporter subunit B